MEFNGTFLATIITFILFVFLMNKVLYVPILGIMEKRRIFVDENYKNTESNNLKADELTKEKEGKLLDAKNDAPIQLPLIGISRSGGYRVTNQSKRPMSFDGFTLDASIQKSIQLNCIPITISYQLDVYARYLAEADEITRNLVFNIINYPKLTVCIPYNGHNVLHNSNIRMDEEISDNSSIPERLSLGQFSRLSIPLTIDDAYLWDTRVRNNISLVWGIEEDV